MKQLFYRRRFIFVPFMAAACLALVSFVIMQLWNALLPEILHTGTVTYWQAMGLFVLCKLLFGFGRGGGFGRSWGGRRDFGERFKHMTDEEREAFRAQMRRTGRCWQRDTERPGEAMKE